MIGFALFLTTLLAAQVALWKGSELLMSVVYRKMERNRERDRHVPLP